MSPPKSKRGDETPSGAPAKAPGRGSIVYSPTPIGVPPSSSPRDFSRRFEFGQNSVCGSARRGARRNSTHGGLRMQPTRTIDSNQRVRTPAVDPDLRLVGGTRVLVPYSYSKSIDHSAAHSLLEEAERRAYALGGLRKGPWEGALSILEPSGSKAGTPASSSVSSSAAAAAAAAAVAAAASSISGTSTSSSSGVTLEPSSASSSLPSNGAGPKPVLSFTYQKPGLPHGWNIVLAGRQQPAVLLRDSTETLMAMGYKVVSEVRWRGTEYDIGDFSVRVAICSHFPRVQQQPVSHSVPICVLLEVEYRPCIFPGWGLQILRDFVMYFCHPPSLKLEDQASIEASWKTFQMSLGPMSRVREFDLPTLLRLYFMLIQSFGIFPSSDLQ